MRFEEAVRELSEGHCKGIKRSDISTLCLKDNGRLIFKDTVDNEYDSYSCHILADDWELVDPIPQYEEVPIVRYLWINRCTGAEGLTTKEGLMPSQCDVVKLHGTQKVEVKPKVFHREEVNDIYQSVGSNQTLYAPFIYNGKKVQLFAEWSE